MRIHQECELQEKKEQEDEILSDTSLVLEICIQRRLSMEELAKL